eukprot:TRINITY_DN7894_c0_g1_i2.p1 TRINITY_DN7894_c0_g1~~TRINITY_DN7894_c0_g1_i2.p1  ORF type:complete len:111 (-),score=59.84 TRINITY_DN7894_c0_g1_i2:79-411(-)
MIPDNAKGKETAQHNSGEHLINSSELSQKFDETENEMAEKEKSEQPQVNTEEKKEEKEKEKEKEKKKEQESITNPVVSKPRELPPLHTTHTNINNTPKDESFDIKKKKKQ